MGQGLRVNWVSLTLRDQPFTTGLLLLNGDGSFERTGNISAQLVEKVERSITQQDQNFFYIEYIEYIE